MTSTTASNQPPFGTRTPDELVHVAAINILSSTLQLMACQFRMYAKHHEAKGDHEKALHNAKLAELADNVLAQVAKGEA